MATSVHSNQLTLQARIVGISTLRFTPAGVPALDLQLQHDSEQSEAGVLRQLQMELKAVALGTVAERLMNQTLGTDAVFRGFLAPVKRSKHVQLHIQDFSLV